MNEPNAIELPRDRWLRRILDRTEDVAPADGPGRVLRLKLGFNPNSSSVGSVVTTLLWSASVSMVALNIAAALIRGNRDSATPHGAPAEGLTTGDETDAP